MKNDVGEESQIPEGTVQKFQGLEKAARWREIRRYSKPFGNETLEKTWESGTSCSD